MKEKYLKMQVMLSEKWLPNAIFLFIISFFLLPSSKAVNNFYYIGLLAPAILCINKLRWQDSFKVVNFKALYLFGLFAALSLFWSPEENVKFKDVTPVIYTIMFCQIIFFILMERDKEFLIKRLKQTLVITSLVTFALILINPKYLGNRLILPTRMDHPIQFASVSALSALLSLNFFTEKPMNKSHLIWLFVFSLNLGVTLKTQSRGPLLAFTLVSGCILLYRFRKKAIKPISIFVVTLILIALYSLSGNSLQFSRLSEKEQTLEFLFKPDKDTDSISILLGIQGKGELHLDKLKIRDGNGNIIFQDEFNDNPRTNGKWKDVNTENISNSNGKLILVNETKMSSYLKTGNIKLKENISMIELKLVGEVKECLLASQFIGASINLIYKDKSKQRINRLLVISRLFRGLDKESRPIIWEEAINSALENFIIGKGISSKFSLTLGEREILHAHNLWVSTFYKFGGIGLLLICTILYTKKISIYSFVLMYSCLCAFFDMPDFFCSPREAWIYFMIPLIAFITFNNTASKVESKKK